MSRTQVETTLTGTAGGGGGGDMEVCIKFENHWGEAARGDYSDRYSWGRGCVKFENHWGEAARGDYSDRYS